MRSDNILIKSVGAHYPIAKAFLEGTPNPAGEKLNRRIDIRIAQITTEPIKIQYEEPIVSPFMAESAGEKINLHQHYNCSNNRTNRWFYEQFHVFEAFFR